MEFTLFKNDQAYRFTTDTNFNIESWIEALSEYVIRTDKPQCYKILKVLGEGGCATVKLAEEIFNNEIKTQDSIE